jgi:hypothetical protein
MRTRLPSVRVDVNVLEGQAYCRLVNMTGHFVRFRLPSATVKVPGNTVANVVADFSEGFRISTDEDGLLFGDAMKVTRSGQPWNNRDGGSEPISAAPVIAEAVTEVVEEAAPIDIDTSSLTVTEVLGWVGDDAARKTAALKSERKGKARKSLIASLSE